MGQLEYWVCFDDVNDPSRVVDPVYEGILPANTRRVFVGLDAEQKANDLAQTMNAWPSRGSAPGVWMPGNIRARVEAFMSI